MEWELIKENIQPLKKGRNVEALCQAATVKPEGSVQLEEHRRTLVQAIDDYSGEDPLQPWLKYIKWIKENFPSVKQELLPVLESCTKSFKDDLRYKDDNRYLRVWVQYADCSQDPLDIFKFLEANSICQGHALFYEAYAISLEFRRNYAKSALVYQKGIARGAEPLLRLKNMFRTYQERMVKRVERQIKEEKEAGLGGKPRHSSSAFHAVGRGNAPVLSQGQHLNRESQQRLHQQERIKQSDEGQISRSSRKEQAFSVFADEERPGESVDPIGSNVGPWSSLGTQADRTKENRQVPTKWTNVKIPQKKIPGQKTPAELDVYVDEEFAGTSIPKVQDEPIQRHEELPVRTRLDGSTNPTRATELVSQLPSTDPTLVLTEITAAGNQTKEKEGFITEVQVDIAAQHSISIVFPLGSRHAYGFNPTRNRIEASFEEIRLFSMVGDDLEYWAQLESPAIPCQEDAKAVDQELSDKVVKQKQETVVLNPRPMAVGAPCSLLTKFSDVASESEKKRCQIPCLKVSEDVPEANGMVFELSKSELASVIPFGNTSGTVKPALIAAQDHVDNTCVFDGEETTALRKIGAGPIFSDGNDEDSSESPFGLNPKEGRHNSMVEPTINTKEALADIMSMFNEPLPCADRKPRKNKRIEDASGRESKRTKTAMESFEVFCDDERELETDGQMNADQSEVGVTGVDLTNKGKENFVQKESFDSDEENRSPPGCPKECNRGPQQKTGFPESQQSSVQPLNELCLKKSKADKGLNEVSASGGGDEEAGKHANESLRMPENNWRDDFTVWEDGPPQAVASGMAATLAYSERETNQSDLFPGGEPLCLDPWEPAIVEGVLAKLTPPLHHYEGYFDYRHEQLSSNTPSDFTKRKSAAPIYIHLGGTAYMVKSCLGEGAFARIYQAYICNVDITETTHFNATLALKVQKPACPWEFYIYRQLDARIPALERASFGRAQEFYLYAGCSVLVCDAKEDGTLQDVINAHLSSRLNMPEVLCVFYTIELLRILEIVHSAHIIHGDFKPDNLLIRRDPGPFSVPWSPSRPKNWMDKGLCLIDWGRSIDLARFPIGSTFKGDCKTEAFRCTEMTEGKPWTFQTDTFGLCGIVHCMLHGSYMEVEKVTEPLGNRVYKPRTPFKRNMKKELWQKLFHTLLNVEDCQNNPPLGPLRYEFEEYLKQLNTSNTLRLLLMKQNTLMTEYMKVKRKTMR